MKYVHNYALVFTLSHAATQLYDGRDMYRIYYIKNNYMFRDFTLAILRLRNEKKKLSNQLYLSIAAY